MFYKVSEKGNGITIATFFDMATKEEFTQKVWDIDDTRVESEAGELYNMPINNEARKAWLLHKGIVSIGDTIEVFQGRQKACPKGTISKVVKEYIYYDNYRRPQSYYWILEDGTKALQHNCRLV